METEVKPLVTAKPSLIHTIKLNWQPTPLAEPSVDREFQNMDLLQRTSEAVRYSLLSLEWWLSPGGTLREWLRFNTVIAAVLSMPALLVVPLVTYLLGQFATWTALLGRIAGNLIIFPLTVVCGIAVVSAGILFIRVLARR